MSTNRTEKFLDSEEEPLDPSTVIGSFVEYPGATLNDQGYLYELDDSGAHVIVFENPVTNSSGGLNAQILRTAEPLKWDNVQVLADRTTMLQGTGLKSDRICYYGKESQPVMPFTTINTIDGNRFVLFHPLNIPFSADNLIPVLVGELQIKIMLESN